MKKFMDPDFLLDTDIARELYHSAASRSPNIDYHNHLSPQEIYEDPCYRSITEAWLAGDHYKWRAMRANGVPEELVTGDGDPYEKFLAWADTIRNSVGNPLYHWTHLELQRHFGIDECLSPETAPEIWNACNQKLSQKDFSVRNLLKRMQVQVLCTTDDPADSLHYHELLASEEDAFHVYPTFRPEKALGIEKEGFPEYLKKLEDLTNVPCDNIKGILKALELRLDFFVKAGCRVTDHSLENHFYIPATEDQVNKILQKRLRGEALTETDCGMYHGFLLTYLGKMYAHRDLAMQLHIGAIRNTSTRMYRKLGPDTGFDSINDFNYAPELAALLDAMDQTDELPKTILYYLNPKDADMLAAMAGNYQSNSRGIRGKIQLGTAWWFCDHRRGMEQQMDSLANLGLLSTSIGMVTDSRSFLSFSRHEYYRRILCRKIGQWVENGEYPDDRGYLNDLIERISLRNAKEYFEL